MDRKSLSRMQAMDKHHDLEEQVSQGAKALLDSEERGMQLEERVGDLESDLERANQIQEEGEVTT